MEQTLDDIAIGKVKWLTYLKGFYKGDTGLETQVQFRAHDIDIDTATKSRMTPR